MTSPAPIVFGPQACGDLAAGAAREWLVTDGLGGYAMGTVSGLRTRRYHGLLVLADGAPARRILSLAALDPVVVLPGGGRVRLGVHEWADGAVAPTGHHLLERFDLDDGVPRWRWRTGGVVIEREIAMVHGSASVAVVHRLIAGGPVDLEIEALVTWRDAHGERGAWGPPPSVGAVDGGAEIEGRVRMRGPGWAPAGDWYRGVRMRAEAGRGLNAIEDLWAAGRFHARLDAAGDVAGVSAWDVETGAGAGDPPPAADAVVAARARARDIVRLAAPRDGVDARLALAADAFVTVAPDVVAGYPWFGTWSRDTMTSYEGLFLDTGRASEGARLLESYAATVSEGMLANTADTGATEYNTVDATLWFVHALGRHVDRTGDTDLGARLLPVLDEVVTAHLAGTRYGIRIDADGLLTQGGDGVALTWMDARVDGVGVTARTGKPVEVNALWVRALAAARRLRGVAGRDDADLAGLEASARLAFTRRFPVGGGGAPDVVDGPGGDDHALRPNLVLAAGLPDSPLPADGVVAVVGDLLTPLGLRSLHPADPAYRGRHRGGPAERDGAYHQGTVWPWLVGPYVDAALAAGRAADDVLAGLEAHLGEAGLGSVSETADGDPPHGPTGCPFQAWSVAETLRARRRIAHAMDHQEEAGQ